MIDSRPSILVVDEDPLSLDRLGRVLADEFDVHRALGAAEAEGCLARDYIQAVIADQRLPEMRGVDFLVRVREQWPDAVRLILLAPPAADGLVDGVTRQLYREDADHFFSTLKAYDAKEF